MIRTEAVELGDALGVLVARLMDDTPNMGELHSLLGDAIKVITEGADFAKIPKAERMKAGIHALSVAQMFVVENEIVYSDEGTE